MPQASGKTALTNAGHCRQPEREERRKRGQRIDSVGYDAGKKIKGKKRHAAVDTLGLMVALIVSPADIQDRDAAASAAGRSAAAADSAVVRCTAPVQWELHLGIARAPGHSPWRFPPPLFLPLTCRSRKVR